MKQHLKWVLSLAGVIALIVACQQAMGPTETRPPGQAPADSGQARAMVSPSPIVSVVPGFPGGIPNPVPGGSGIPVPKPTNPIGPTTTTTTTTSTTSTTTTTTTTLPPGGCPATLVLDATDTPVVGSGGTVQSAIRVAGFDPRCLVQGVEIAFQVTGNLSTSDLTLNATLAGPPVLNAEVFVGQSTPGSTTPPLPLSGTRLGSTCGSLIFRNGGAPFTSATPPYDGTFRPVDLRPGHGGQASFTVLEGSRVNGDWRFSMGFNGDPLTLQCFTIRFTLGLGPG